MFLFISMYKHTVIYIYIYSCAIQHCASTANYSKSGYMRDTVCPFSNTERPLPFHGTVPHGNWIQSGWWFQLISDMMKMLISKNGSRFLLLIGWYCKPKYWHHFLHHFSWPCHLAILFNVVQQIYSGYGWVWLKNGLAALVMIRDFRWLYVGE